MSEKGLHVKYDEKKAGTDEVVSDCFVLRPDRDPAAVAALVMYASVTENTNLSKDIFKWLERFGIEEKLLYTRNFLKAVNGNRKLFESLLSSIVESPFQSEHGDLWVSTPLATAVCTELCYAAIDERFEDYFDFRELADKEENLLLIID
jgi:hypothetical protein